MQTHYHKEPGCSNIKQYIDAHLAFCKNLFYQLTPAELVSHALGRGEGVLSSTGALVINTGDFTGRSPKDRFIVQDEVTETETDWNEFNQPLAAHYFEALFNKMIAYVKGRGIGVRDAMFVQKPITVSHTGDQ